MNCPVCLRQNVNSQLKRMAKKILKCHRDHWFVENLLIIPDGQDEMCVLIPIDPSSGSISSGSCFQILCRELP
jgi:hypothetical protein